MFQTGKQPQSINFLEALYSPTDLWANAYVWLVNIGKYMLIFVEVVVLIVFFSRFVLDRKNNDLTEEINNKVILLSNENWRKNAILFENYQVLFSDIKRVRNGQETNSTIISELISGVPSSLSFENFSYNEGRVSFYLKTSNLDIVNNYEAALKNNPDYHDIRFSLNKDENDVSVRVTFNLYESTSD
jgi:hypothetical protein